ncbi:VOC family protein [Bailinhaonella thermotolerans]|uniref:VOC family protein n=1 Tax=Bailinhaonella thermotolerans TaxID=1070861 RepID=A0A3A4B9G9_9ACTN|nr:VOC family protein [Bailinhaonella thermotolerans]RJL34364.1 VOC family protein [Bailinhaonella thermotolerans]
MTTPAFNTVAWFEIASDDPDGAQKFFGELFGWSFEKDPELPMDYRIITYPGSGEPRGGVFGTGGQLPNHGVFSIVVRDVEETCAQVERLGGKVLKKAVGGPSGPDFAYLTDPSDNLFGVYAPRP